MARPAILPWVLAASSCSTRRGTPSRESGKQLPGDHLHPLFPEVVVEEGGQVGRKNHMADARSGEDHADLLAPHGQGSRDLRADEASAQDPEAPLPRRKLLYPPLSI